MLTAYAIRVSSISSRKPFHSSLQPHFAVSLRQNYRSESQNKEDFSPQK